jgi:hypothetical protein
MAVDARWGSHWRCIRHLRENQRVLQHIARSDGGRLFGEQALVDKVLSTELWQQLQRWDALLLPVHRVATTLHSDVVTADRWHDCVAQLAGEMKGVGDLPCGLDRALVDECVGRRFEFMSDPAFEVAKILSPCTPTMGMSKHFRDTVFAFLDGYLPPRATTLPPDDRPDDRPDLQDEVAERDRSISDARMKLLLALCNWDQDKPAIVESFGVRDPSVCPPAAFWRSLVPSDGEGCTPVLRPLALKLLTYVVNSAGVERHLKALQSVHSTLHDRVSATTMEQLLFVRMSLGTPAAFNTSLAAARRVKATRRSMPAASRKRQRDDDDAAADDSDAAGEEAEVCPAPPTQFVVSAEERRLLAELELADADAECFDGDDAVLDAGLF